MKRYAKIMAATLVLLAPVLPGSPLIAEEKQAPAAPGPRLVVNQAVPDTTLDRSSIKAVFAGRKTAWSDGTRIRVAVLREGECHKQFLAEFLGKTPSQFLIYWRKRVFTGRGKAPHVVRSENEMLEYLKTTEGAIGYASLEPVQGTKEIDVKETKQ